MMTTTMPRRRRNAAGLLLLLLIIGGEGRGGTPDVTATTSRVAFVKRSPHLVHAGQTTTARIAVFGDDAALSSTSHLVLLRGGADVMGEGEEDEYDEEEEEEEEKVLVATGDVDDDDDERDNDEQLEASLAAAAVKSAAKTKARTASSKTRSAKQAVNKKLVADKKEATATVSKKKTKSSGGMVKFFHIPYIVKASMNPLTLFAMTRAFWASLFQLDYLKQREAPGQELRSALEEKAKRTGSSSSKKKPGSGGGRRKMKRGQAKTLSDLPQLSS